MCGDDFVGELQRNLNSFKKELTNQCIW